MKSIENELKKSRSQLINAFKITVESSIEHEYYKKKEAEKKLSISERIKKMNESTGKVVYVHHNNNQSDFMKAAMYVKKITEHNNEVTLDPRHGDLEMF